MALSQNIVNDAITALTVGENLSQEVAAVKTATSTGSITNYATAAEGALALASAAGLSSTTASKIGTGISIIENTLPFFQVLLQALKEVKL